MEGALHQVFKLISASEISLLCSDHVTVMIILAQASGFESTGQLQGMVVLMRDSRLHIKGNMPLSCIMGYVGSSVLRDGIIDDAKGQDIFVSVVTV